MTRIDQTLFSEHEHRVEKEHCEKCGGIVIIKHSKHGLFKCCANYPQCNYTQTLTHNDGHVIKALGVACPKCSNELVLRQGRFGMFIGCSAYPACQHIEKREQESQSDSLNVSCPECAKGQLLEKQSRYGKRFYACNAYPKCKFAINAKPIAGTCVKCGYSLLFEKILADGAALFCADKKCHSKQS